MNWQQKKYHLWPSLDFFFFDSEDVLSLFQMQTGVLDFIMTQAIRLP